MYIDRTTVSETKKYRQETEKIQQVIQAVSKLLKQGHVARLSGKRFPPEIEMRCPVCSTWHILLSENSPKNCSNCPANYDDPTTRTIKQENYREQAHNRINSSCKRLNDFYDQDTKKLTLQESDEMLKIALSQSISDLEVALYTMEICTHV